MTELEILQLGLYNDIITTFIITFFLTMYLWYLILKK